jgi:hypothetical protein
VIDTEEKRVASDVSVHALCNVPLGGEIPNVPYAVVSGFVGEWARDRLIGQGGFGDVFEGSFWDPDAECEVHVAVKRLNEVQFGGADRYLISRSYSCSGRCN